MRSCIYCGRELAPGEKCSCRQSAQHRPGGEPQQEQKKTENTYSGYNDPNRTEYRTGYTKKDNIFTRMREKARARSNAKQNSRVNVKYEGRRFWQTVLEAIRSPIDNVRNPSMLKLVQMLLLWAVQGALAWLCIFFILSHAARGPFAMLANLLAFHGVAGYQTVGYVLLSLLSGAVAGVVGFFLYTGVLYGINRLLLRDKMTRYEEFCQRLAFTAVPFSIIALVGSLLSLISITTLIVLLCCGAAIFVVLTYEALRTQWSGINANRVIYMMMLGFFVIATVAGYVIRLS